MLIFLAAPQVLLFSFYQCLLPLECPSEIRNLSRQESRKYIVDSAFEKSFEFLDPIFHHLFEKYMFYTAKRRTIDFVLDAITSAAYYSLKSFDVAEDFFLGNIRSLRIIFDSGASTNLVFYHLPNDPVVGPRTLNLAAGETSSGNISMSGEISLSKQLVESGKCTEELISMGRYAMTCGAVWWAGPTCNLYTRTQDGNWKLLYELPVERNCPVMTPEQALFVRELQRMSLTGQSFKSSDATQPTEENQFEFSGSVAILNKYSESFEYFYQEGRFNNSLDIFNNFSPEDLYEVWQIAESPTDYIDKLQTLFERREAVVNFSNSEAHHSPPGTTHAAQEPNSNRQVPNAGESANPVGKEQRDRSKRVQFEIDHLRAQFSGLETPDTFSLYPLPKSSHTDNVDFGHGLKEGPNPNANKAPQRRTDLAQKLKFYRDTKGAWVIWGDIHFSSVEGFDGSHYTWVYHCSRLKAANPSKPKLEEIENVELCYPVKENNAVTACSGLRHCLESLGIWSDDAKTKVNFYFESEVEKGTIDTVVFNDFLLAAHGSHHTSIPYRHPAKEFAVKNLLLKIRSQIANSSMPTSSWSAIARALSEQACSKISGKPYPNRTFEKGYSVDLVGKLVYAHVPGLGARSVDDRQTPAILLNSAPRNRVYIIHATEKDLGFRCTSVDWSQISFPEHKPWVFEAEQIDNLKIKKYMKVPFQSRLISKSKSELPAKVTCKRCLRLKGRGDARDHENDNLVRGHALDKGCNYMSYDCFSNVEFAPDVAFFDECPLAHMFSKINEFSDSFSSVEDNTKESINCKESDASETFRSCFNRPVDSNRNDLTSFNRLKEAFRATKELKQFIFGNNVSELTPEDAATLLFMAREEVKQSVFKKAAEEAEKCSRYDSTWDDEFYSMVILTGKQVVERSKTNPKELTDWLEANEKELSNLIERGVVKLVKITELKNLDPNSYEIIPSLCVYAVKGTGRKKARLVACGNYQLTADKEVEGIQTGVYAGTTSQVVWRSLLNIFAQGRQSIAAMDVSEAFTQTDEKSQETGNRTMKTFLRLPSQWRSIVLPKLLEKAGCNVNNYNQYLLQVLKSIYGETFAPKRWKETLRRVLEGFGFKEAQLEESIYFLVEGGQVTIISTYVDDIWIFSQNPDRMVEIMYEISCKLRCTPAEILCGAPDYFWKGEGNVDFGHEPKLTEKQKKIREFFKPLSGPKRFGVATKQTALSYVSIDLYFENDFLILDQSGYIEKTYQKMKEKGVFKDEEVFVVQSLREEIYKHLWLFEDCEKNPLLTKQELSLLRIGVNTISFYALSVGIGLQAALGQIARGQSAGRRRHLEALKTLIFYTYQTRNTVLRVECPSYLEPCKTLSETQIFVHGHWDASMGNSGPLGTDPYARQGCVLMAGVNESMLAPVQGKSALQSTISLSTCEAELTASTWCAKQIIGLINLLREIFDHGPENQANIEVPKMYGDNKAANLLASNQASMRNHRHLQLPQIWIRNLTRDGKIKVFNITTHLNTADMLTKVLPHQKLFKLLEYLGYTVKGAVVNAFSRIEVMNI